MAGGARPIFLSPHRHLLKLSRHPKSLNTRTLAHPLTSSSTQCSSSSPSLLRLSPSSPLHSLQLSSTSLRASSLGVATTRVSKRVATPGPCSAATLSTVPKTRLFKPSPGFYPSASKTSLRKLAWFATPSAPSLLPGTPGMYSRSISYPFLITHLSCSSSQPVCCSENNYSKSITLLRVRPLANFQIYRWSRCCRVHPHQRQPLKSGGKCERTLLFTTVTAYIPYILYLT